jgi:hypothetical protein
VVFLNNEPSQTNVLWAKHVGYNTYSFYLFYEGDWHPTDEITNITISTFPGLISSFVNDAGYLTEHQSLENYYTKQQADDKFLTEHQSLADYALKEEIPSIDGLASELWVQSQGYLTSHQDISGKLDKTEAVQIYQPKGNYLTEHQDITGKLDKADAYYSDVYVGTGNNYANVMMVGSHYDNLIKGSGINVSSASEYLWVIMPSVYSPIVLLSGLEVQMTVSTITQEDIEYKVMRSDSRYTGTFNVILI